jgi:hypothetical protein
VKCSSPGNDRVLSITFKAPSIIEVWYLLTTDPARSVYPMSKCVLNTTMTLSVLRFGCCALASARIRKVRIENKRVFMRYDIDVNYNEKYFPVIGAVEKVLSSSCHP